MTYRRNSAYKHQALDHVYVGVGRTDKIAKEVARGPQGEWVGEDMR